MRRRGRTRGPAGPEAVLTNCTGSAVRRVSYRGMREKSRYQARPASLSQWTECVDLANCVGGMRPAFAQGYGGRHAFRKRSNCPRGKRRRFDSFTQFAKSMEPSLSNQRRENTMYDLPQATALAAYQSGQIGNSAAGLSTPKPSVTVEIITRLENLNSILRDVIVGQRHLMEMLHGSCPEVANDVKASAPSPSGTLNAIDERLNWLMNSAQEIASNQQTLDRLA